jgi:hypothetical protein
MILPIHKHILAFEDMIETIEILHVLFLTHQLTYNRMVSTTGNPILVFFRSSNQGTISIAKYQASKYL